MVFLTSQTPSLFFQGFRKVEDQDVIGYIHALTGKNLYSMLLSVSKSILTTKTIESLEFFVKNTKTLTNFTFQNSYTAQNFKLNFQMAAKETIYLKKKQPNRFLRLFLSSKTSFVSDFSSSSHHFTRTLEIQCLKNRSNNPSMILGNSISTAMGSLLARNTLKSFYLTVTSLNSKISDPFLVETGKGLARCFELQEFKLDLSNSLHEITDEGFISFAQGLRSCTNLFQVDVFME